MRDPAGSLAFERPLGARPVDDERTELRVWAPHAERVTVVLSGREEPLEPVGHGVHEAVLRARAGEDYRLRLGDGAEWPDPCSREQPEGVLGPTRILDTRPFAWSDTGWPGLRLDPQTVLYELHVGAFTPEGTLDAIVPRLPGLAELGVSAIELMPVATFPGDRNWGYDGLYIGAVHPAYGGPAALARLVDAAHAEGIAVVLDVVYNHVGPGSEALAAFGPYFSGKYHTPWGDAVNFDDPGSGAVREWAIQNAEGWVRDFHVDGLRLDAVHAIYDASADPITCELARRVRAVTDREVALIAETDRNDPLTTVDCGGGGQGFDAQWADDQHHALHALLTGEREGYYADYGDVGALAAAARSPFVFQGGYSRYLDRRRGAPLGRPAPERFVVCAQNHDQVGNRAVGDRLSPRAGRLAALWTLLSPWVPMLFMGEEHGERNPFQFFTDHIDPAIAAATRDGRRREFAEFAGFARDVPDPQDPETMRHSIVDPSGGDPGTLTLYRRLIGLRRELPPSPPTNVEADEERRTVIVHRGDVAICANFSPDRTETLDVDAARIVLDTAGARLEGGRLELPALSGAAVR